MRVATRAFLALLMLSAVFTLANAQQLGKLPLWPIAEIGPEIPPALIDHWASPPFSTKCPGRPGAYSAYPSKRKWLAAAVKGDPPTFEPCDDGDAIIFLGMLCLAGHAESCVGVADAQNRSTGEWYRSSRRRWMAPTAACAESANVDGSKYCAECTHTFSRDHGIGAFLYVLKQQDHDALRRYFTNMEVNGAAHELIDEAGRRIGAPWARYCARDGECVARNLDGSVNTGDSRHATVVAGYRGGSCVLLPVQDSPDYAFMSRVTGVARGPLLTTATESDEILLGIAGMATSLVPSPIPVAPLLGTPAPLRNVLISATSKPHFPLHLEATRVLLRMVANNPELSFRKLPSRPTASQVIADPLDPMLSTGQHALHANAVTIHSRQPKNPFYQLLAQGPNPAVRARILELCPAAGQVPPQPATDKEKEEALYVWRWETDVEAEFAQKHSMGWDCVFVGLLYNKMRVPADIRDELFEYFDAIANPISQLVEANNVLIAQAQTAVFQADAVLAASQGALDFLNGQAGRDAEALRGRARQGRDSLQELANALAAHNVVVRSIEAVGEPRGCKLLGDRDPGCREYRRRLNAARAERDRINAAAASAQAALNDIADRQVRELQDRVLAAQRTLTEQPLELAREALARARRDLASAQEANREVAKKNAALKETAKVWKR